MSFDKPSNSGDDDPGRQDERRPFGTDLSIEGDERESRNGQGTDNPPATGDRDRPQEGGEPGTAARGGPYEFTADDYIPFTREESRADAQDPDAAGKPELGSREWLEAKAGLWERRATGEDVEIPGWDIPFTRDDVREWADSPNRDNIPAPGTPVWEVWKADRAARDRPAVIGDPDKPKPLPAEASNGNGEGARTSEKAGSTDKPETTDWNAERAEKLESELSETKAERSKLIDTVSRQAAKIERQDARAEKLESDNDKLRAENARLKAELAEKDKPAEVIGAVVRKQRDTADKAEVTGEPDRERRHLPGGEAVSVLTGTVGGVDAAATAAHVMTSSEGTIVGASAALGAAVYIYAKSKWEKSHGDKPGA